MIKMAGIEFEEQALTKAYFEHKYIVKYRTIYALEWCENLIGFKVHARPIYYKNFGLPLTKRGRFFLMSASEINRLLDFKFLNEEVGEN